MSSSVYASSHNIAPVSVNTNLSSYATGDAILLSGFVKDYDGEFQVTILIINPQGNVVHIAQFAPNPDGNYSTSTIASGMIKKVGEYIVKVAYGPQTIKQYLSSLAVRDLYHRLLHKQHQNK